MSNTEHPYVVLFTYAPAGLGHLRVTDALYDGLSKEVPSTLYSSSDKSLTTMHRITSIHPIARRIAEWVQNSKRAESVFTKYYRSVLVSHAENTYRDIMAHLEKEHITTKHLVVVATHFGLAHQIAQAKKVFEESGIHITLVVQVTDDSPQHIWYVEKADYIFVPSEYTKTTLRAYGKRHHFHIPKFIVSPYPVSPALCEQLTKEQYQEREHQYEAASDTPIHVAVPISGAAVGMEYYVKLLPKLYALSPRFIFHIIARDTLYTHMFLQKMKALAYVHINFRYSDRAVVDLYEEIYKKHVIGFEITKPSEQAFKSLISPRQVGGAVLLFTLPVGRQEYDNLNFMRTHLLIPSKEDQKTMWKKAMGNEARCFFDPSGWRGVVLPTGTTVGSRLIFNLFIKGAYKEMMAKKKYIKADELGSDGVKLFWKMLHEKTGLKF